MQSLYTRYMVLSHLAPAVDALAVARLLRCEVRCRSGPQVDVRAIRSKVTSCALSVQFDVTRLRELRKAITGGLE